MRDSLGSSHDLHSPMTFTTRSLRSRMLGWRDHIQALLEALPLSAVPARRIIEQFRKAGVVAPQRAQPFHPSSRVDEDAFLHLLELRVIREPARGRYYLDEDSLETVCKQGLPPLW